MLKASNLKAQGFSLGFGVCNPLRAESTPEGLSYGSVSPTDNLHHIQFDRLLEISETRLEGGHLMLLGLMFDINGY